MPQQMSSAELYERGFALMELRMFHPAIDDFQTAARDARYARKAYVPMGLCLSALGRHEEAVAAFRRALRLPIISSFVQRHILYHLGRTLESMGRGAESLEVYGWISEGDPEFLDVAQRITYVSSGKGRFYLRILNWWGVLVNGVHAYRRTQPPHMQTVSDQTVQCLGGSAEMWVQPDKSGISSSLSSDATVEIYAHSGSPSGRMS